jgi:hypothetical protein
MCPPMAPERPLCENGDFGRSPIYGQLSDTHCVSVRGAPEVKHKGSRNKCRVQSPRQALCFLIACKASIKELQSLGRSGAF